MFTKVTFESAAKALSHRQSFENILNEARNYNSRTAEVSIFLSHSHYDMRIVKIARAFFESFGVRIYVDWTDESMPKTTCGETAAKIKDKIQQNQFFIFLATDIALFSKWCNWEVGYADNWKYSPDKMAIIPISDNRDQWKGSEYLQLYPEIIQIGNGLEVSSYYVRYPNGKFKTLLSWLHCK